MSKQLLLALGAGGAATAAVVASAASLGTVDSTDLGAGTSVVSSCDDDGIDVSYTTAFSGGAYKVATVRLDGVDDACAGQGVKVTLYDDSGDSVGSGALTSSAFAGNTADVTISGTASAEAVEGVAVVISHIPSPP